MLQWVIVYGFKAGDLDLLLQEFSKCGEIMQHGTFGAPASANWLYLQFEVNSSLQRSRHDRRAHSDCRQASTMQHASYCYLL